MPKESVIKHYSSSTTGSVPLAADLVEGELAINTADERIYFENASGQVINFGESRGISATYARRSSVVSSLNGLTGALNVTGDGGAIVGVGNDTIRARLATASLTGVASFPATDFAVSAAGAVTLTGNVAKTNVAQTFTALQTFSVGISGAGATFSGIVNVGGNLTVDTTIFHVDAANNRVGIGTTSAQSSLDVITPANSFVHVGTNMSIGQWAGVGFGYRESNTLYRKSAIVFERTDNSGSGANAAGKVHILNGPAAGGNSATLADARITIGELGNVGIGTTAPTSPLTVSGNASVSGSLTAGTLFASNIVNSFNSLTGAVSYSPAIASASVTGVASFPATDFAVSAAGAVSVTGNFVRTVVVGGSTLTGNVSLTAGSNITLTPSGSTITIASSGGGGGVTTSAANTWTATQTFSGGINVSAGATFSGSVESDTGYRIGAGAINAQTVGYSLVAGDNGKVITINSASAITLTAGTAVGTTGFSCTIIQLGTGTVRLAASGVTMNSYSGLTFAGQHAAASLVCYQTNVFNVSGNLTP